MNVDYFLTNHCGGSNPFVLTFSQRWVFDCHNRDDLNLNCKLVEDMLCVHYCAVSVEIGRRVESEAELIPRHCVLILSDGGGGASRIDVGDIAVFDVRWVGGLD